MKENRDSIESKELDTSSLGSTRSSVYSEQSVDDNISVQSVDSGYESDTSLTKQQDSHISNKVQSKVEDIDRLIRRFYSYKAANLDAKFKTGSRGLLDSETFITTNQSFLSVISDLGGENFATYLSDDKTEKLLDNLMLNTKLSYSFMKDNPDAKKKLEQQYANTEAKLKGIVLGDTNSKNRNEKIVNKALKKVLLNLVEKKIPKQKYAQLVVEYTMKKLKSNKSKFNSEQLNLFKELVEAKNKTAKFAKERENASSEERKAIDKATDQSVNSFIQELVQERENQWVATQAFADYTQNTKDISASMARISDLNLSTKLLSKEIIEKCSESICKELNSKIPQKTRNKIWECVSPTLIELGSDVLKDHKESIISDLTKNFIKYKSRGSYLTKNLSISRKNLQTVNLQLQKDYKNPVILVDSNIIDQKPSLEQDSVAKDIQTSSVIVDRELTVATTTETPIATIEMRKSNTVQRNCEQLEKLSEDSANLLSVKTREPSIVQQEVISHSMPTIIEPEQESAIECLSKYSTLPKNVKLLIDNVDVDIKAEIQSIKQKLKPLTVTVKTVEKQAPIRLPQLKSTGHKLW